MNCIIIPVYHRFQTIIAQHIYYHIPLYNRNNFLVELSPYWHDTAMHQQTCCICLELCCHPATKNNGSSMYFKCTQCRDGYVCINCFNTFVSYSHQTYRGTVIKCPVCTTTMCHHLDHVKVQQRRRHSHALCIVYGLTVLLYGVVGIVMALVPWLLAYLSFSNDPRRSFFYVGGHH